ncbi:hypothetical protein [Saccharopolyspora kobensis]|uniref:hypothetical protein n=1 Tax=Saccharopolyspora kobensis TaxID=146035 RepID=UPI000B847943|nr:hypothetical protein [Saccharopolyspora kobensis]
MSWDSRSRSPHLIVDGLLIGSTEPVVRHHARVVTNNIVAVVLNTGQQRWAVSPGCTGTAEPPTACGWRPVFAVP